MYFFTINVCVFRNNDLQEISLEREEGTLRFAIVNGFRNIQNIVQKLKRKKNPYDYVEIMACPSGQFLLLFSPKYFGIIFILSHP